MVLGALATAAIIIVGIVYYSRPRSKTTGNGRGDLEVIKSHKILTDVI